MLTKTDPTKAAAGRETISTSRLLHVVMYHYVRRLRASRFPRLKAMELQDFRAQLTELGERFEWATVESACDFLAGRYTPAKDLCLLTFDDGLAEHYHAVTPLLREMGVQGVFFPITACLETNVVAPVHMNHLLLADLGFHEYRRRFLRELAERTGGASAQFVCDFERAAVAYRWDPPEVGRFKFLLNYILDKEVCEELLRELFHDHFGDEAELASSLYINWEQAREMQRAGMSLGGHSHNHRNLGALDDDELCDEVGLCRGLLRRRLDEQALWPFSIPYGKAASFGAATLARIRANGFDCVFNTIVGSNSQPGNCYRIQRIDCKDVGGHERNPGRQGIAC